MKTAVEEIREALRSCIGLGEPWLSDIRVALARLDELEAIVGKHVRGECAEAAVSAYKQGMDDDRVKLAIAKAEERGRRSERADILAHAVQTRSYWVLADSIRLGEHVGAAERAKGGGNQ